MLVGCNKNKIEVKEGVKIQIHSHDDKARKLKEGDIVSFLIKIKTGSDSLLQEQIDKTKPARDMVKPLEKLDTKVLCKMDCVCWQLVIVQRFTYQLIQFQRVDSNCLRS